MRNLFLGGLIALVVLGGCGRKELPQPDTSEPLRMINLQHSQELNVINLSFTIVGGYGDVGYQIDRAELDSVCNCLTPWRRHFEQSLLPKRGVELVRNLKLLSTEREFAFRIRAIDAAGSMSPWSAPMQARGIDPLK